MYSPHPLPQPAQNIAVELHIDNPAWMVKLLMNSPFNISEQFLMLLLTWYACFGHGNDGLFHWDDCCFWVIPINPTFVICYDLGEKVWVISGLFMNLTADTHTVLLLALTFKSMDRIRLQVPYVRHMISQISWIVHLRSSRMASHTCEMFSGIVPADGRSERLSSSIDVQPFFKCLYQS